MEEGGGVEGKWSGRRKVEEGGGVGGKWKKVEESGGRWRGRRGTLSLERWKGLKYH